MSWGYLLFSVKSSDQISFFWSWMDVIPQVRSGGRPICVYFSVSVSHSWRLKNLTWDVQDTNSDELLNTGMWTKLTFRHWVHVAIQVGWKAFTTNVIQRVRNRFRCCCILMYCFVFFCPSTSKIRQELLKSQPFLLAAGKYLLNLSLGSVIFHMS